MVERNPSELREMFGRNLRVLSADYPSISELARLLKINRTQLNRYLSGESFPRPDILARICAFFDTDARILIDPVENLGSTDQVLGAPYLHGFLGARMQEIEEDVLPSGFYRFSRRSFVDHELYVVGLVHVRRHGRNTVLRGFETREAMRLQGLPLDARSREFRGLILQQEDGLTILAARHNAMTCSFSYLSKIASFQNNFWVGYSTRTVMEAADGLRATRMAYEYLGPSAKTAIEITKSLGFKALEDVPPFHARLLRPGVPFT